MFTSEMTECHNKTVTIYDVDETALVALIEFAYTSRITLTTDNVQTLLYACSILQVYTLLCARLPIPDVNNIMRLTWKTVVNIHNSLCVCADSYDITM